MHRSQRSPRFCPRLRRLAALALFLAAALAAPDPTQAACLTLVQEWGQYGSGPGEFQSVWGIARDSVGDLYTSDISVGRVQRFDSAGNLILSWGTYGTGPGEFQGARGIAVGANDRVFVVENGGRIQKFKKTGSYVTEWTGPGQAHAIAVSPVSGDLFVTSAATNEVNKYQDDGTPLLSWGGTGTGPGEFDLGQGGIVVDGSGHVYVGDQLNSRIQKFDENGTFLLEWGSFGTGNGEFWAGPLGLAYTDNDVIWAIDQSRIQAFKANGTYLCSYTYPTIFTALVADPVGFTVWAVNEGDHRIAEHGLVSVPVRETVDVASWGRVKTMFRR